MVYRITVDGKKCYAEATIREYSLEADNKAREAIIQRYLDEEGAQEVTFDTSFDEAKPTGTLKLKQAVFAGV